MEKKSLFDYLYDNRDSRKICIEIINDNNKEIEKKRTSEIKNTNLSSDIKKFFLQQILHLSGEFSYSDLYCLVDFYVKKLSNEEKQFNNYYPIIVDEKVYLENIALIIASLHINLNPVLVGQVDKDIINNLNDYFKYSKLNDNCCYITTSGTTGIPKVVPVEEQKIIKSIFDFYVNELNIKNETFYSCNSVLGISGLKQNCFLPIITDNKVIISDEENFFVNIAKKKANVFMLPMNYSTYLSSDYHLEKYDFSSVKYILMSGGYYNTHDIKLLRRNLINLGKNVFVYIYGMTETCGIIGYTKEQDMIPLYVNFLDSINNKLRKSTFITYILSNNFEKNNSRLLDVGTALRFKSTNWIAMSGKSVINDSYHICSNDDIDICNGYVEFLPCCKVYKKGINLAENDYGDIIVNNFKTKDYGIVLNGLLYVLYRNFDDNNKTSFIENYFTCLFNIQTTSLIHNNKLCLIMDVPDGTSLDKIIEFERIYYRSISNLKESNIKFDNFVYIKELPRSKMLKKILKSKIIFTKKYCEQFQYLVNNYEKIFMAILLLLNKDLPYDFTDILKVYDNYINKLEHNFNDSNAIEIFTHFCINSIIIYLMNYLGSDIEFKDIILEKYEFDEKEIKKIIAKSNKLGKIIANKLFNNKNEFDIESMQVYISNLIDEEKSKIFIIDKVMIK